jgi:hypothetical protein
VKSHPWRFFLAFGLAAAVVYFLLANDERLSTASSAVLHYIAAGAVVAGVRRHRPADPWPWYLIAVALVSLGTGDALFSSSMPDLADACWLVAYLILTVALLRLVRARSRGRDVRCWMRSWSPSVSGWCPGGS